jgi:hypothetical protein
MIIQHHKTDTASNIYTQLHLQDKTTYSEILIRSSEEKKKSALKQTSLHVHLPCDLRNPEVDKVESKAWLKHHDL